MTRLQGPLFRAGDAALLLLSGGLGLLWGLGSLLLVFSWDFASSTGTLRAVLALLALPFYGAAQLARLLPLSIIDPSGVTIASGLGLALGLVVVSLLRWSER